MKSVLFLSGAFLLTTYSSWASAAPQVELVQSVPVETHLALPGVRMANDVWIDLIDHAQKNIDLEQFYISDEPGKALAPVMQSLVRAAGRGVKIRFIVDLKFSAQYPDSIEELARVADITMGKIDYGKIAGGVQHAKFFVVDGRESFVGSQNFDWRALDQIHEIGLHLSSVKIASDLESIFETDWSQCTPNAAPPAPITLPVIDPSDPSSFIPEASPTNYKIVASPESKNPVGIGYSGQAILDLIHSAKKSIQIQVMEYSTHVAGTQERWLYIDDALRAAATRGILVDLMVDVSDLKKAKDDLVSLAQVPNVHVKYVTIPQASTGPIPFARLIHSKYMVIDGTSSWVGSENWSKGYFINTRDVGLTIQASDISGELSQIFDSLWQSNYSGAL